MDLPQNVIYRNGQYYTGSIPLLDTNNSFGNLTKGVNNAMTYKVMNDPAMFAKYYTAITPPAPTQPAVQQSPMQAIQPQLNRLTGQASQALYGGLLGYNPQPLTSGGNNPQSFAAPQGYFRSAFAGLQGLLGGNNGMA